MSEKKIPVVVTTAHRGVFVGYHDSGELPESGHVVLSDARMVVYYDRSCRGVLGVGSRGVGSSSRVSPPVPMIALRGCTAMWRATPEAAAAWEEEPWG